MNDLRYAVYRMDCEHYPYTVYYEVPPVGYHVAWVGLGEDGTSVYWGPSHGVAHTAMDHSEEVRVHMAELPEHIRLSIKRELSKLDYALTEGEI